MTEPADGHRPDPGAAIATAPYPPVIAGGTYSVWAPHASRVDLRVNGTVHAMHAAGDGWFVAPDLKADAGDRYAFRLDGGELWLPDPRSRFQPDGVHAASEVVDAAAVSTSPTREGWGGCDLRGAVLYELHVGTFTSGPSGRGGTLDSAIARLDELVDLGVDAVELMPLAPFPGERGWGYDGVGLYGVHRAYGGPQALARFVAAAHERGLGVVLDVVHNHMGPDGNYLGLFGPYFTSAHSTPWGEALNLDQDGSAQVRAFVLDSVRQYLVEVGIDALRLDAVHELKDDSDRHLLAEMSDAVESWSQKLGRPLALIAESDRNDPLTVTPTAHGGLGQTMQWADDIHHAIHAWATGERQGYYGDFGSAEVVKKTLERVFLHDGSFSTFRGSTWGAPVDPTTDLYNAHSFVASLQNHDQVGNRASGDRLDEAVRPGQHAAAIALILAGPATVMLFQGEEWACSTPFAFFTDHNDELGPLVTAGRRGEFAAMGWDEAAVRDPQDPHTFFDSILDWSERARTPHAQMLAWYRTLIRLRHDEPDLRDPRFTQVAVSVLSEETVLMRRGSVAVLAHRGAGPVAREEVVAAAYAEGAPELTEADGLVPGGSASGEPSFEVLAQWEESDPGAADGALLTGPGAVILRLPA